MLQLLFILVAIFTDLRNTTAIFLGKYFILQQERYFNDYINDVMMLMMLMINDVHNDLSRHVSLHEEHVN